MEIIAGLMYIALWVWLLRQIFYYLTRNTRKRRTDEY